MLLHNCQLCKHFNCERNNCSYSDPYPDDKGCQFTPINLEVFREANPPVKFDPLCLVAPERRAESLANKERRASAVDWLEQQKNKLRDLIARKATQ